jgi:acetyl/propionyl-CoA carboxylase alpha subunit
VSYSKILVANRGEIACRVLRTAQRLGYRTVAVYSDADSQALHVRQADEAAHLGAAPAAASYLNSAAVIAAARATGADAVHPGYGFLSESADFAQACLDAGLVFIGPPPSAMRAMGDKAEAKRRMAAAGVPCAPGYLGPDQADERLAEEARRLGLPLLVKAVHGGGGRGMRQVRNWAGLGAALDAARREAQAAFGDGRLMLERLIEDARHVEIQIFADAHGNAVHLGERECSVQRRHQKVVEEAPCPLLNPVMRAAMGRDAVAAALAVGYRGAGTVEFLVDPHLNHCFLEMNTRLQVEHPVTECLTGLDLVEWQLRVAAGEPLPLAQEQIVFSGHAIEVRLVAEDPADGFKPQGGRILHWQPDATPLRIDHGVQAGDELTPHYDGLLAKYIAHGADRPDAIRRLQRALLDAPLLGPQTNASFLHALLGHPRFAAGEMTTASLDEMAAAGDALLQPAEPPEEAWLLAAALRAGDSGRRPASVALFDLTLSCRGQQRRLRAPPADCRVLHRDGARLRYQLRGVQGQAHAADEGQVTHLALPMGLFRFREASPWPAPPRTDDRGQARAPVAGTVAKVAVALGERVNAGQALVCVQAMKMEMWLDAATAGTVRAVHARAGEAVASGALLVEVEADS